GGRDALGTTVDDPEFTAAADRLYRALDDLEPSLWRGGSTYPASQDDVTRLYGSGEIDAFLTYGPGSVAQSVRDGVFPASTRETVLSVGNIANNSFVAIPYNARHKAAAMVLANQLLDPDTQLELYRATGAYPAVDLSALPLVERAAFDAVDLGPSVLPISELTAHTLPELPASFVTRIESDWKTRVLQR
ncbi:MAG: extracellular solute-binding protein, partial [Sporichthyaceae bacterium]